MAKDVDLSSQEWTDLVFEGKNKEFGAYQLRNSSAKRHNWAMLSVVIVIIAAFLISLGVSALQRAEDEGPAAITEQDVVSIDTSTDDVEEPEEEPEERFEEPEVEEVLPEEVLNTVKVTELAIVNDEEVSKEDEIKTQEELTQTTTAFGASDFDQGTDDVTVVREHKEEIVVEEKHEPEQVFTVVEQMPEFPGGTKALMTWLAEHIRYPEQAAQNDIQGRVTLQFVVEKDGSIGEVKVVRSKDPDLDREAVRVVKSLPKFLPGKMNGQNVRVWFTLPVQFRLAN